MTERLNSVAFEWATIGWLISEPSLFWFASLLTVLGFSIRCARRNGLNPRIMALTGVFCILGAHVGGHLSEVLAAPKALIEDPLIVFRFMEGGKGIFCALLGAGFSGWLYLRWKKASFLAYAETAAPAIALGYAIARIGCFLNGCCFGTPSDLPWAVKFPENTLAFYEHWMKGWLNSNDVLSLAVHPTQLYHAAGGFILFLVLHRFKPKWVGGRLVIGLAGYGFLRFFLQFVRGDRTPVFGFLDVNQIFSLIFVLIAGLLWWRLARQQKTSKEVMADSFCQGRL